MKRIAVWVVVPCFALPSALIEAYEPTTHIILSGRAVNWSVLASDSTLLSDLGLAPINVSQFTDSTGLTQTTTGIVQAGANLEDAGPFPIVRPRNHFYDHQYNGFQGRGLSNVFFGLPSPDWALEDRGNVQSLDGNGPSREQLWSYRHAQEQLRLGLTAQTVAQRAAAFSYAFQSLGHVIHHLQDMAQPQHTRNDLHFPVSPYELYTQERNGQIEGILAAGRPLYPNPRFDSVRLFFATPSVGSLFRGMAEFTGQNYVSADSMFTVVRTTGEPIFSSNANLPLPNHLNRDGTQKRTVAIPVTVQHRDGSVVTEYADTVVGDVVDDYYNRTFKDKRLAVSSGVWATAGLVQTLEMTPEVFDNNYPILLPRATAFSAGLIDHFFRGRVNFARASNGTDWVMTNASQYTMNGTFSVYAEDGAGSRQAVPGALFARNLAPGATSTVTFPEPASSTAKLVLAFLGQVGAEVPPDDGFRAVAGKVINYTLPPVACAGTTNRNGGVGGLNIVRELGSTAGNVQLEFEAYSIPDGLVVRSENAAQTQLATTSGPVSGRRTWNLSYNPATLGSTRVRMVVTAPDPNTAWNFTLGCPGQTINNGDRDFPLVTATFRFGGSLQGAFGGCSADVWIDGAYRFTANAIAGQTPAIRTALLSVGVGHGLEYRNYSCQSGTQNLLVGASVSDPAGHEHTLPAMNLTQTIHMFDIHAQ